MKRVFVDTSAWFAYVRRDDPDHEAVKAALAGWEDRLVTSNFVFDEVVTLVRARFGHAAALKVGATLQDAGIDYDSAESGFQPSVSVQVDLEAARKVLKLVDALEDSDDVQEVYTNVDIPEDVAAALDED